ncbi:MAG: trigger factor [Patescibacteria group bacterium]
MKTEIKKLPKAQLELLVEVPADEVRPYLEKAAIKLSQSIKIDGWRPGKAPYKIVKNKVGEMEILKEAVDEIISQTYFKILQEKEIVTIGQPSIELEKLAPNNPVSYKATVAVLPKLKLGEYKNIKLSRTPVKVDDKKVEQVVEDIRKMRAKEKLVERAAGTGDRLLTDFDVFLDKVPIENGSQKKYPVTIGEQRFIPGFEEQLVGLKAGEQKEFELKFPNEYYQKNLAGKTCVFKVKVNAVYEVELPPVDDEFAKTISGGQFATALEMKGSIKKNLEQEEKNKQEQRLETELLEKIVNISEFEEIPDVLIDNEIHKMKHELEDSLAQQGFAFADYLKSINKSIEDLEKEFRPAAEQRVKTAIICREIYAEQKMAVRPDEVEQEIESLLKNYPNNPEAQKQSTSETYKDYLKNVLGNRKVIDYLKSIIVK